MLEAPSKSATNKTIMCRRSTGCSLHLHSYSSPTQPPPYSQENAIGLIMGVGNLGYFLKDRNDELNTYFTRDGGLTWFEVRKGPHIFEFGDHGALIAMAPSHKATEFLEFSWNQGLTW